MTMCMMCIEGEENEGEGGGGGGRLHFQRGISVLLPPHSELLCPQIHCRHDHVSMGFQNVQDMIRSRLRHGCLSSPIPKVPEITDCPHPVGPKSSLKPRISLTSAAHFQVSLASQAWALLHPSPSPGRAAQRKRNKEPARKPRFPVGFWQTYMILVLILPGLSV